MSGTQVITLGCRLNLSESEQIRAMLAREDDLVVVNSCAVTVSYTHLTLPTTVFV